MRQGNGKKIAGRSQKGKGQRHRQTDHKVSSLVYCTFDFDQPAVIQDILMGNKKARMYDGSMSEWSRGKDLPVEVKINAQ